MWCVEIKEDIIFLIVHTSSDNLEKENGGKMCWQLLQETDWFNGDFRMARLCYSQESEDVYKAIE